MVIVTTDRQSAFDRLLASVPFKGQVLNQTSGASAAAAAANGSQLSGQRTISPPRRRDALPLFPSEQHGGWRTRAISSRTPCSLHRMPTWQS